jgi:hypothetical protein
MVVTMLAMPYPAWWLQSKKQTWWGVRYVKDSPFRVRWEGGVGNGVSRLYISRFAESNVRRWLKAERGKRVGSEAPAVWHVNRQEPWATSLVHVSHTRNSHPVTLSLSPRPSAGLKAG